MDDNLDHEEAEKAAIHGDQERGFHNKSVEKSGEGEDGDGSINVERGCKTSSDG